MKLFVGGADRSGDIGDSLQRAAAELATHPDAPADWEPFHSALFLREARDSSDYTTKLIDLLVLKAETSATDFYVQRRSGLLGSVMAGVRKFLWKVLRYQHDRARFQQNTVNTQLAIALQFLREQHDREILELRNRIEALEGRSCRDA